jgi:hypothetical protein
MASQTTVRDAQITRSSSSTAWPLQRASLVCQYRGSRGSSPKNGHGQNSSVGAEGQVREGAELRAEQS